jgi:hypothetical protein
MLPTPKRQIGTAVSVLDGARSTPQYDSLADVAHPARHQRQQQRRTPSQTLRIRGEEGYRTLP